MNAEIITIGDELISGDVVDTNSAYISKRLRSNGIKATYHISVGDDEMRIIDVLNSAINRSEIIIVSGGMGPTFDDITTSVIAKIFKRGLVFHEDIVQKLEERFKMMGLDMPQSNEKQAYIPEGAEIIPNPVGTAPGFFIKYNEKIIICLPGVPREIKRMLDGEVIPILRRLNYIDKIIGERLLKVFGLPESRVDELIKDLVKSKDNLELGLIAVFPEVHIRISIKGSDEKTVGAELSRIEDELRKRIGEYIFGRDGDTLEGIVGELLRKNKASISVAESCTGGLIANRITNVAGSSDYFDRGYVVYSNRSKIEILGIQKNLIEKYGAVSFEVAKAMAEGAREASGSTFAIGVTGIAGPGGGTEEKPVGTVHIAMTDGKETRGNQYRFIGGREMIKMITSEMALDMLRRYLPH